MSLGKMPCASIAADNCLLTTLGVQAVPSQFFAGYDVQPMQLAGNAQARFIGVDTIDHEWMM